MGSGQIVELKFVINVSVTVQGGSNEQGSSPVDETSINQSATRLSALYEMFLSNHDKENNVSVKTVRSNHSTLNRFEKWCEDKFSVKPGKCVPLLSQPGILKEYAVFLRSQEKGCSASMCQKALGVIGKLSTVCLKNGIISSKPDSVSKSQINNLKPRTERQRRIKAVPVTLSELNSMLNVLDGCKWPQIGTVTPAMFWKTCLLSHFVYGFRSQDWFACRTSEKKGLLWSGVVNESKCPVVDNLHNAAGWVWYLVHKTSKKDEAAERPADVLVPLSARMRDLIELFRGIDMERVFPIPNNSRSYSREFAGILNRANLSDTERIKSGKSIIRLSLGQRDVASFRKSASALWAQHVNRSASSYMLHHAIAEERVSRMTTDSYLQDEDILRKITSTIETLPIWQSC
jgi:hypothetical protein